MRDDGEGLLDEISVRLTPQHGIVPELEHRQFWLPFRSDFACRIRRAFDISLPDGQEVDMLQQERIGIQCDLEQFNLTESLVRGTFAQLTRTQTLRTLVELRARSALAAIRGVRALGPS